MLLWKEWISCRKKKVLDPTARQISDGLGKEPEQEWRISFFYLKKGKGPVLLDKRNTPMIITKEVKRELRAQIQMIWILSIHF